jgi:predicted DNA-binding ribbon-helix-helix protein
VVQEYAMNACKVRGVSIPKFESAAGIPPSKYRTRDDGLMKSAVVKRSVAVGGHRTSVSLEEEFWTQLKEIAGAKQITLSQLIARIDEGREHANLSSAIRVYVLQHSVNFATAG